MRTWIKLHTDILNDPKICRMGDHLCRRLIETWLLAAHHDDNGNLPPLREVAAVLHVADEPGLFALIDDINELVRHGFLEYKGNECHVVNYSRLIPQADDWLEIRANILARDNRTCQYCGAPASHVDHVIPRCQGGTNDRDNLVAACQHCNLSKSGRTPEQAGMEFHHGTR